MEDPLALETQQIPANSAPELFPAATPCADPVGPVAEEAPAPPGNWIMPLVGMLIVLGVVFGSLYSSYHRPPSGPLISGAQAVPITGNQAPDFTLDDLNGNQVRLAGLQGKPVLLNMWATWCTYCVEEMPAIEQAYRRHRSKGLQVLAVDIDSGEAVADVRRYVQKLGLSFTILLSGDAVAQAYQIQPIPTSFFIDRQGVIRDVAWGAMNRQMLEQKLATIL